MDLTLVREWEAHRVGRYPRIPLVLAAPRLAQRVIAISRATADDVMRLTRTPARKIDVVPLAPRPSARPVAAELVAHVTAKHGLAPGGYLMVPATIEPRKNHARILEAFESLVKDGSLSTDMRLLFAGQVGWRAASILDRIEESPVRPRVVMPGYVPDDELIALYTGAAAIVFVSTSEGFGMPILEGLACGTPVVTSNLSAMPEVAGDAAILADPFDVASIARAMLEALSADAAIRAHGRAHAARFTWAATAKATATVYEAAQR
jgi:glycosyltransferase involved in cell wall biosynthesis